MMAMFHIHKVEQSEQPHTKFALWLVDGYLAYATVTHAEKSRKSFLNG